MSRPPKSSDRSKSWAGFVKFPPPRSKGDASAGECCRGLRSEARSAAIGSGLSRGSDVGKALRGAEPMAGESDGGARTDEPPPLGINEGMGAGDDAGRSGDSGNWPHAPEPARHTAQANIPVTRGPAHSRRRHRPGRSSRRTGVPSPRHGPADAQQNLGTRLMVGFLPMGWIRGADIPVRHRPSKVGTRLLEPRQPSPHPLMCPDSLLSVNANPPRCSTTLAGLPTRGAPSRG
jgi:hypothetical protein